MKIAIIGIQGLPNNYGGFETLTDFLVRYLSTDIDITVYCSNEVEKQTNNIYNGAKLKYINISSHGAKGIVYDSLSLINACKSDFNIIIILGFGPGLIIPFLPLSIKKKIILNFGGLDWQRDKWGKFARGIIHFCEKQLVRNANIIISDNKKIKDYINNTYKKESTLIAYGGDQVEKKEITDKLITKYPFLKSKYAFGVARIQPDNNIEMLINAFIMNENMPLVIVGNWESTKYGRELKDKFKDNSYLILLEAIYDRNILDVLRSNCHLYVHGHSAGGTNPSLCEAMFLGLPIFAFSNGYNQETTYNKAMYFHNAEELKDLILTIPIEKLDQMGTELKQIAAVHYRWETVTRQYLREFQKIIK